MTAPSPRPRRPPRMLSQVFAVNAAILTTCAGLLALAPVTISVPIALAELALVLVTLAVMLAANLAVLRRVLEPLDELTSLTRLVDPVTVGANTSLSFGRVAETEQLASAFEAMVERLERERRGSVARALRAQEEERARIARELHDELGQTLTALMLRAERAAHGEPGDANAALLELAGALEYSLDEIRRIARELRPEALDDLGLVNALISLCSRLDTSSPTRVSWTIEKELPSLQAEVELAVYRIAQEALTNALRHAGSGRVALTLRHVDGEVVLEVRDDGSGFDPAGERQTVGTGLSGMRERALLVGGDLAIGHAGPDGGTLVSLTIPTEASVPR